MFQKFYFFYRNVANLQKISDTCLLMNLLLSIFCSAFLVSNLFGEDVTALKMSEKLFEAGLYEEAALQYSSEKEISSSDAYRLALSYFFSEQYLKALETLERHCLPARYPEAYYLQALAQYKLKNYSLAIQSLNEYLGFLPVEHEEEAYIYLGKSHFYLQQYELAKQYCQKSLKSEGSQYLLNLYLVRIALHEGKRSDANQLLNALAKQAPPNPLIAYEKCFLQGEEALCRMDYVEAIQHYQRSLPMNFPEKMEWYLETILKQSRCHLIMGKEGANKEAETHFKEAERILLKAITYLPEEKLYLALGECYITWASKLSLDEMNKQAETLLSDKNLFKTEGGQVHALLLRAKSAASYDERDLLYRKVISQLNGESALLPDCLEAKGRNDFEEGLSLLHKGEKPLADVAFERARNDFAQAYHLLENSQPEKAAHCWLQMAKSSCYQSSTEKKVEGIHYLEDCFHSKSDLVAKMHHPEELLYCYAFACSQVIQLDACYVKKATTSLHHLIEKYEATARYKDAFFLLGKIYFLVRAYDQAENCFLNVVNKFPNASEACESLHWAYKAADAQNRRESALKYRLKLIEEHPKTLYGEEACFTLYSIREYLQGSKEANKHLHKFIEKYPNSVFSAQCWFLLGTNYKRDRKTEEGKWIQKKNLTEAVEAFKKAENLFDANLSHADHEGRAKMAHLRLKAGLERGLANLAISKESSHPKRQIYLHYSKEVLSHLYYQYLPSNHSLFSQLLGSEALFILQSEIGYYLAQVCVEEGGYQTAREMLNQIVEWHENRKISMGYLLALSWIEKGKIAATQKEYEEALACYHKAEESSKGKVLSSEEFHQLLMLQSETYLAMDKYAETILTLSKIINDESASSMRIQAMYRRAEIYEKQGRHLLARRQLESVAQKGGEWSLKAQTKLENEYGYL